MFGFKSFEGPLLVLMVPIAIRGGYLITIVCKSKPDVASPIGKSRFAILIK